ncbi:uncharacterized protein LOC103715493 [Phoenix dactylifera]|uniref:Uncharacterized protein LOC103715493 n=1 Tax=Phoenix dactylifera TaxID=42345 RepID=A0A8B7CL47_PHODC|nr:uncharacterized protein LOC103715493 [Phoenix dactylifera]
MEGKKTTASTADNLFGQKEAASSPKSSSSSSSGYFSSVFPPASSVMAKDSARSDLYRTLDKQTTEGHIGSAQSSRAGDKYQGSPIKGHTSNKDGKSAYPTESIESPYFGSSVHYGGREFYSSAPSVRSSGAPSSFKAKDEDNLGDSDVATRGDWWQGSLYY